MAFHHIIPRFHLARWADDDGRLEVFDRRDLSVREEDPRRFYAEPDFNRIVGPNGEDDPWLEHEFLGGLDSEAARLMRQLEALPRPAGLRKQASHRGWHPIHVLGPRDSVRFAMYIGAQAVRSPAWREMVHLHLAATMRKCVESGARRDLEVETDPVRRKELEQLLGLRYMVKMEGNHVPWLSGHLAYRLGSVLYEEFEWAVLEFPSPLLLLGNDPVLFWSLSRKRASGSFSQIADEDKDDPFLSTWTDDLTAIGDRAVEVVRDRDLVLFPLDPRRLLVLSRFAGMFSPGVHHVRPEMARVANLLMLVASADWVALPGGGGAAVRAAIHARHPWARRRDEATEAT